MAKNFWDEEADSGGSAPTITMPPQPEPLNYWDFDPGESPPAPPPPEPLPADYVDPGIRRAAQAPAAPVPAPAPTPGPAPAPAQTPVPEQASPAAAATPVPVAAPTPVPPAPAPEIDPATGLPIEQPPVQPEPLSPGTDLGGGQPSPDSYLLRTPTYPRQGGYGSLDEARAAAVRQVNETRDRLAAGTRIAGDLAADLATRQEADLARQRATADQQAAAESRQYLLDVYRTVFGDNYTPSHDSSVTSQGVARDLVARAQKLKEKMGPVWTADDDKTLFALEKIAALAAPRRGHPVEADATAPELQGGRLGGHPAALDPANEDLLLRPVVPGNIYVPGLTEEALIHSLPPEVQDQVRPVISPNQWGRRGLFSANSKLAATALGYQRAFSADEQALRASLDIISQHPLPLPATWLLSGVPANPGQLLEGATWAADGVARGIAGIISLAASVTPPTPQEGVPFFQPDTSAYLAEQQKAVSALKAAFSKIPQDNLTTPLDYLRAVGQVGYDSYSVPVLTGAAAMVFNPVNMIPLPIIDRLVEAGLALSARGGSQALIAAARALAAHGGAGPRVADALDFLAYHTPDALIPRDIKRVFADESLRIKGQPPLILSDPALRAAAEEVRAGLAEWDPGSGRWVRASTRSPRPWDEGIRQVYRDPAAFLDDIHMNLTHDVVPPYNPDRDPGLVNAVSHDALVREARDLPKVYVAEGNQAGLEAIPSGRRALPETALPLRLVEPDARALTPGQLLYDVQAPVENPLVYRSLESAAAEASSYPSTSVYYDGIRAQGYDSIYLPPSQATPGALVHLYPERVSFHNPRSVTEGFIASEAARQAGMRALRASGALTRSEVLRAIGAYEKDRLAGTLDRPAVTEPHQQVTEILTNPGEIAAPDTFAPSPTPEAITPTEQGIAARFRDTFNLTGDQSLIVARLIGANASAQGLTLEQWLALYLADLRAGSAERFLAEHALSLPAGETAKGATTFLTNGRAIVHAFESADFSTAVHELAHVLMEHLPSDDLNTILRAYGGGSGVITDPLRERFARAFERYLREGKAPTPALRGVFAKAKAFMLAIYRSFRDFGVTISPEVRGLFDRMLATPEDLILRDQEGLISHYRDYKEFFSGDPAAHPFIKDNDLALSTAVTGQPLRFFGFRTERQSTFTGPVHGGRVRRGTRLNDFRGTGVAYGISPVKAESVYLSREARSFGLTPSGSRRLREVDPAQLMSVDEITLQNPLVVDGAHRTLILNLDHYLPNVDPEDAIQLAALLEYPMNGEESGFALMDRKLRQVAEKEGYDGIVYRLRDPETAASKALDEVPSYTPTEVVVFHPPEKGLAKYQLGETVPAAVPGEPSAAAVPANASDQLQPQRLLAAPPSPAGLLPAPPVPGPVFYSATLRALESLPQQRLAVDQIRAALKSVAGSAEEMKWTGFDDWLNTRRGKSVTVKDAVEWLRSHQIEVEESTYKGKQTSYSNYTLNGSPENYHELLLRIPGFGGSPYHSPHWDEPNVLAHVRFSDRTGADGRRVLFIEEIQSDWHQTGRKEGYYESRYTRPPDPDAVSPSGAAVSEEPAGNRVPSAPFQKTWSDLALKRVLRWAAENNYDSIAWTTGAQQAKRYSGIGERGMEGFYDKILPSKAASIGKQWGVKPETGTVTVETKVPAYSGPQYTLDELRKALASIEGDFSEGDFASRVSPLTGETLLFPVNRGSVTEPLRGVIWNMESGRTFTEAISSFRGYEPDRDLVDLLGGRVLYDTVQNSEAVHSLPVTVEMRRSITREGLPLFQRTEKGKRRYATPVINRQRLLENMQNKFYESAPAATTVKELVQNAADAVGALGVSEREGLASELRQKMAETWHVDPSNVSDFELGYYTQPEHVGIFGSDFADLANRYREAGTSPPKGSLSIALDTRDRSITATDTGIGMDGDVLTGPFVSPYDTFKVGAENRGGFGVAKAAILGNAEKIDVMTVTVKGGKKVRSRLTGTGKDWQNGVIGEGPGLEILEDERPVSAAVPTGTTVRIVLPEGTDFDSARSWLEKMAEVNQTGSPLSYTIDGAAPPANPAAVSFTPATRNVSSWGAQLDFFTGGQAEETATVTVDVLNRGIYQFSTNVSLPRAVVVPPHVLVDVKPTVEVNHADYPFTTNREQLGYGARYSVENWVKKDLAGAALEAQDRVFKNALLNSPQIGGGGLGRIIDPAGIIDPAKLAELGQRPWAESLARRVQMMVRSAQDALEARFSRLAPRPDTGLSLSGPFNAVNLNLTAYEAGRGNAIYVNPFSIYKETLAENRLFAQAVQTGDSAVMAEELANRFVATTAEHEMAHQLAWEHGEYFGNRMSVVAAAVLDDLSRLRNGIKSDLARMMTQNGGAAWKEFLRDYDWWRELDTSGNLHAGITLGDAAFGTGSAAGAAAEDVGRGGRGPRGELGGGPVPGDQPGLSALADELQSRKPLLQTGPPALPPGGGGPPAFPPGGPGGPPAPPPGGGGNFYPFGRAPLVPYRSFPRLREPLSESWRQTFRRALPDRIFSGADLGTQAQEMFTDVLTKSNTLERRLEEWFGKGAVPPELMTEHIAAFARSYSTTGAFYYKRMMDEIESTARATSGSSLLAGKWDSAHPAQSYRDDLEVYLHLKHQISVAQKLGNPDRLGPGGVQGIQHAQTELFNLAQELGPRKFQAVEDGAAVFARASKEQLDRKVANGLVSPSLATELTRDYPYYAPVAIIDALDEELANKRAFTGGGAAFSVRDNALKRIQSLAGTEAENYSPITSMAKHMISSQQLMGKNGAASSIAKAAELLGEGRRIAPGSSHASGKGVISFFENGSRVDMEVPREYEWEVEHLSSSLSPDALSLAAQALQSWSRLGAIHYAPAFPLSNLIADTITSMFTVRPGMQEIVQSIVKTALHELDIRKDPIIESMEQFGFVGGRFFGQTPAETAGQLEDYGVYGLRGFGEGNALTRRPIQELRQRAFDLRYQPGLLNLSLSQSPHVSGRIPSMLGLMKDTALAAVGLSEWQMLGNISEIALRRANFVMEAKRKGIEILPGRTGINAAGVDLPFDYAGTMEDFTKALWVSGLAARRGTADFDRHGYIPGVLNNFVFLINASTQGMLTLPRAARANPIRAASAMAAFGAAAFLLYLYNRRFKEYGNIPWYIKARSVIMMQDSDDFDPLTGEKQAKFLAFVPNTREVSTITGSLAIALEAIDQKHPDVLAGAGVIAQSTLPATSLEDLAPGGIPARVVLEAVMNQDFLKQRPIVPDNVAKKPLPDQYDRTTLEIFKAAGKAWNLSPMAMQRFAMSLGAGGGGAIVRMLELAYRGWSQDQTSPATLALAQKYQEAVDWTSPSAWEKRDQFLANLSADQQNALREYLTRADTPIPHLDDIRRRFFPRGGGQLKADARRLALEQQGITDPQVLAQSTAYSQAVGERMGQIKEQVRALAEKVDQGKISRAELRGFLQDQIAPKYEAVKEDFGVIWPLAGQVQDPDQWRAFMLKTQEILGNNPSEEERAKILESAWHLIQPPKNGDGTTDWDTYFTQRSTFEGSLSDKDLDLLHRALNAGRPPVIRQYYADLDTLRSYWEAGRNVSDNYPQWQQTYTRMQALPVNSPERKALERTPSFQAMQSAAAQAKEVYRRTHPESDALLKDYGYTAETIPERDARELKEKVLPHLESLKLSEAAAARKSGRDSNAFRLASWNRQWYEQNIVARYQQAATDPKVLLERPDPAVNPYSDTVPDAFLRAQIARTVYGKDTYDDPLVKMAVGDFMTSLRLGLRASGKTLASYGSKNRQMAFVMSIVDQARKGDFVKLVPENGAVYQIDGSTLLPDLAKKPEPLTRFATPAVYPIPLPASSPAAAAYEGTEEEARP